MGGRSNPGGGTDELSRRPKQGSISTSLKHKGRSDMESARPKVLVNRKLPAVVESRLRSSYDVRMNTTGQAMRKTELSVAMSNYDAVVSTVLRAGNRRVQLIANVGVGYSNIDTKTLGDEGIAVSNTPGVLTDATGAR
jgi:lactate dehydrogenase-like 2-hydroxyacid dehydrogenase